MQDTALNTPLLAEGQGIAHPSSSAAATSDSTGVAHVDAPVQAECRQNGCRGVLSSVGKTILKAFNPKENAKDVFLRKPCSIDALDGVRALGLLWILAFHCYKFGCDDYMNCPTQSYYDFVYVWWMALIGSGDVGVDILFFTSGFLICHTLVREARKPSEKTLEAISKTRSVLLSIKNYFLFLLRRYIRLTPMLIVGIYINIAYFDFERRNCPGTLWTNWLYVNNFFHQYECCMHTWTMPVEFQLYIITPLLLLCAYNRKTNTPRKYSDLFFFSLALVVLGLRFMAYMIYRDEPTFRTAQVGIIFYDKPWMRACPYFAGMAAYLRFLAYQDEKQRIAFGVQTEEKSVAISNIMNDTTTTSADNHDQGRICNGPGYPAATTSTTVAIDGEKKEQEEAAQHSANTVSCTIPDGPVFSSSSILSAPSPLFKQVTLWLLVPIYLAVCWFGCGFTLNTLTMSQDFNDAMLVAGRFLFSVPLFCITVLTLTDRLPKLSALLSWKGWVPVSRLTFAAYLIQFIFMDLLRFKLHLIPYSLTTNFFMCVVVWLWLMLLTTPVLLTAAFVCYIFVEKPSMSLRV